MSGPEETDLPGGWEAAAAEYVLGLLPEAEAAAFEARLAQDRDLRQDVEAWEEYFATLTDPIAEVAPPPQVLRRTEAQLFGRKRRPVWEQLLPYLLGAVAAAVIAWAVSFSGLLDTRDAPHLYADLETPSRGLVMLAHYAPDSGTFMVRRDAGDYPEGRSLEIWLIAEGAGAPVSLGLVDREGLTEIPVPRAIARQLTGAAVAISEEPEGGSPTGQPTGPVLALGQMAPRG
ncbi:anti-sigma factor [Salipiger sp. P9]|uniref:anti-sigma factor n=1 Tax=Salipiger pentaromativorans TaxID=2943193 RepID=UPI0021575D8F|nr:anti-sigma factor [Salipiger pentaromativorans]MCR8549768.1 anti-sigma factor [Salipiger pentaromativorans]